MTGTNPAPPLLETPKKNAWIASFVAHAVIARRINEALEAAGAVSLETYGVLLALEEAPERHLRMSELADKVLFSRSGITRLVDRLERQGLIERKTCPSDRRACHAILTEKGLAAREAAWPTYAKVVNQLFASQLSEEEAHVISRAFERMVDGYELTGYEPGK